MPATRNSSRRTIPCRDPATGESLGEIEAMTESDVHDKVARARDLQHVWQKSTFSQRRTVLQKLLDYVVENQESIASMSSKETGKTLLEAYYGEILTTCEKLRYTIKEGESMLKPQSRSVPLLLGLKKAHVEYHPLGVVACIVPFNYPFHNIYGPLTSALFAGNCVIVKVSEYCSWSVQKYGEIIRDILEECGFPRDIVQFVIGYGDTGAALVKSGVDKIFFIGSPQNGKRVMEAAAATLTPVVLELGGKDPFIVCDDAELDQAIGVAIRGIFVNCGQNCLAPERFYVHEKVYDEFVKKVVAVGKALRQGPPLEGDYDCGCITMPTQFKIVEDLVADAVSSGAVVAAGGKRNTNWPNGHFFEPTILTNLTDDMKVVREEAFGPLMLILKWSDDDDVIRRANASAYGLSSCIFSTNYERAEKMASRMMAGTSVINDFGIPYLIQSLPFGGCKISGFGKFNGVEGMHECCRVKAVVSDRFPLRTKVPAFTQYPVPRGAHKVIHEAINMIYGNSVSKRIAGGWNLVKKLLTLGKDESQTESKDE